MTRLHNDYVDTVFRGNYAKIYGFMVESIEKTGDTDQLAYLFKHINNSGQSLSLPLAENKEIVRMFIRLGVLETKNAYEKNKVTLDYIVTNISEEADRYPALISVIIRLFSSGQYGIVSVPVCGSSPQCGKCKLTKYCKFYNSPPVDPTYSKLPASKRLNLGADSSITNIELLSMLIGGSRPSPSHINTAMNIFSRYKNLRALSMASLSELMSLRDVGEAAAIRIYSTLLLYKRFTEETNLDKIVIKASEDLYDLFKLELRDQRQENFYIVMLDSMNGIIKQEKIALGGLSSVQVISREVFTPAIREAAVSVALVHNHPSGNPEPSDDDIHLTQQLRKAGELLNIDVVDHIIIGDNRYVSFVDNNIVPFKSLKGSK